MCYSILRIFGALLSLDGVSLFVTVNVNELLIVKIRLYHKVDKLKYSTWSARGGQSWPLKLKLGLAYDVLLRYLAIVFSSRI